MQGETWVALLTLTFLEIILGIDNIIFISIVSNKLPIEEQKRARTIGISFALLIRIGLLLMITWILRSTEPLFSIEALNVDISIRDLILLFGGLFLLFKSTMEINHKMEQQGVDYQATGKSKTWKVILQIILLDIIFSFDSILTAIGLAKELILMIIAVIIAMIVMLVFSEKISKFISKHPSLEILALSFLILIGCMLVVEAFHNEVPKGYIYFAVFFSMSVEFINIRLSKKRRVVRLNKRIEESEIEGPKIDIPSTPISRMNQ